MHAQTPPKTPTNEISDAGSADGQVVHSPLTPVEVAKRLSQAGRRGRLPGYVATSSEAFRIDCDAVPFEYVLLGTIGPGADNGSVIKLHCKRRLLMPAIFAATLVFTVWPGVWLTDSLMGVYWSAYGTWSEQIPWLTYAWYLPISALPLPWVWRKLTRKSKVMAAESETKIIATLRSTLSAA